MSAASQQARHLGRRVERLAEVRTADDAQLIERALVAIDRAAVLYLIERHGEARAVSLLREIARDSREVF